MRFGDVAISDCMFLGNRGGTGGGIGLYACSPLIENCTFRSNYAPYGGGVGGNYSSPTILGCFFLNNTAFYVEGDSLCGDYHDNLFTDPLWCNVENNDFDVCSNSPSLPEHNPWGVTVGASVVIGCGECVTPVEQESWGSIKALFR